MRVVHAIPVYAPAWQFGGPILSVSRLCEGLVQQGVEVDVITTNFGLKPSDQPTALNQASLRNGVRVWYFQHDSDSKRAYSRELLRQLPQVIRGADLLHLSAIWQPLGPPIQKIAAQQNIKVIHSIRGALSPFSFQQKPWLKWPYYWGVEHYWLNNCAALHVTSIQEKHEIERLDLAAPSHLFPNPVNLADLYCSLEVRHKARRKLGVDEKTPLLLICGRQHYKKGLDRLPGLLQSLKNMRWKLLLVGADEDGSGAAMKAKLAEGNLDERIIDMPTTDAKDLNNIYNASDLLLLPSRHENFGNVVIEALACGCQVLISPQTGVSGDLQMHAPRSYGATLPLDSDHWVMWMRQWMQRWLSDNPWSSRETLARWTGENYSQEAVAQRAIQLYRTILEQK